MKLFVVIVTFFLLVTFCEVDSRRTYSTSSSRGRGNRGKNQPSGGGLFSSWLGGSKSSGSSSSSGTASKPVSTSAIKNWQTATSHTSSQSKSSNWANPYYKPAGSAGSAVPSAPKQPTNYGWKPAVGTDTKPASSFPSSNIGSKGYPVQSGVQQGASSFGGYKPAGGISSPPVSNSQPSSFGGYKPSGGVPNTHSTNYQPSQSGFGGYRPSSGVPNTPNTHYQPSSVHNTPNTHYQPSSVHNTQSGFGGYHTAPSHGFQSSHGTPHVNPSYHQPSSGYHPSAYPTQTGGFSSGYHPQSNYHPHSFGSSVPTYQGSSLFGGNTGHYSYPGGGNWGINTYGAKKSSSGTGKLLTGLAVGAAGGYLTSSLVNSISNPWKYSGYGYGSRFGYGSDYGSSYNLIRARDESAFERGYERGARDRNENNKEPQTPPAAPPPTPEDPTSKWVHCVAFDPQTQQTLINPNCSCTVTTSLDERTGQPISVHHCTTLNGLVMKPIPVQGPNLPVLSPEQQQPPVGVNAPGVVPSYMGAYQENGQYGAMPISYSIPNPTETKSEQNSTEEKTEKGFVQTSATTTESKMDEKTTETKLNETATGTVITPEMAVFQNFTNSDSGTGGQSGRTPDIQATPQALGGLTKTEESQKTPDEFYGQLQKIVNMGNFVDGG